MKRIIPLGMQSTVNLVGMGNVFTGWGLRSTQLARVSVDVNNSARAGASRPSLGHRRVENEKRVALTAARAGYCLPVAKRRVPGPAGLARAVGVAGALSGLPSSAHALATRRSLLASTRAAGTLLGRGTVLRGAAAHAVISTGWVAVIAVILPRRRPIAWGLVFGGGIGALDLAIARRCFPAIAALPVGPQLADHAAFGVLAAAVIDWERR
jgi:hypothetical protein